MSTFRYRSYEGPLPDEVFAWLGLLSQSIFGAGDESGFREALAGKQKIHACIVFDQDTPVAFKVGFEERKYYFESWQGGVLESARRQGLATELQRIQHAWCKEQGFRIVSTTTNNQNTAMITLNMKHGFFIVGTVLDRKKHVKVLLQKHLTDEE